MSRACWYSLIMHKKCVMMWQKWCEYKISYLRDGRCSLQLPPAACELFCAPSQPLFGLRLVFLFYMLALFHLPFFFFFFLFLYIFLCHPILYASNIPVQHNRDGTTERAHIYLRSMNLYVRFVSWNICWMLCVITLYTVWSNKQYCEQNQTMCSIYTKLCSFVLIFIFLLLFIVCSVWLPLASTACTWIGFGLCAFFSRMLHVSIFIRAL